MFEMYVTTAKAVLYIRFGGKSMQGGVRAACISVKVTVDFCCAVPFLISGASIAHSSLSLSLCVFLSLYLCFCGSFFLSLALTYTQTRSHSSAGKDTNMILNIGSFLYTSFLSGSVSAIFDGRHTAATIKQSPAEADC